MNSEVGRSIMCRACMKVDGVLLPMYGDDMISKKNLPDKLADLASIHIDKYDGLPTVLCAKCAYRTDSFYDFKLQVQATERKLRKMFQSSNAQNIALKSEANIGDCDNDTHPDAEVFPQTRSSSVSPLDPSITNAATSLEKYVNVDLKPSLEVDKVDEELCVIDANEHYEETINFVDDPLSENGTKEEVPEGIQEIFQSENLGYTFLYIPDEEAADLDAQNAQEAIRMEEEDEEKRVFASASNEDAEAEEIIEDKDSPSELVSWSPEDSRNDEDSVTEKVFPAPHFHGYGTPNARLSATPCQRPEFRDYINSYTLNDQYYYPAQMQQQNYPHNRYQDPLHFTMQQAMHMRQLKSRLLNPGSSHALGDATASDTSDADYASKLAPRKKYANGGILEDALIPGPTKIEIISGSGIYVKMNELERWTRMYGQKSNKLACRLMRLIIGEENLAGMSVTGRGPLQRMPKRAYDAVETYVSTHAMPKMDSEKFQMIMKFLCRTVRKARELK